MTKTTIHSSISNLESCRSRLADRRRRQLRLRQVLVHHLLGENKKLSLIGSSSGDEFTDVYTQVNLSQKLSQCLGVWNNQLHNYNEEAKLKALIMPVVRRLKEPRLSAAAVRLLNKLISENESSSYTITNGCILRVERPTKSTTTQSTNGRNLNDSSYTGSSTFLKGTQSANPHNDYCQHLVDTGERPQNFIRDTGLKNRFEEYPKLRELIRLKDELISVRATPPMYLRTDLLNFDLHELNSVFDVILVEPPLEEYNKVTGVVNDRFWSWLEVERLEIEKIAAPRSFIWIWCGSGEGLDGARKCLRKWGYRRCEDICWIKTNKTRPVHEQLEPGAVFQRTKEHCLMGIHGTVRRSTDGDFIHANLDIDLIISEAKPTESYAAKDKPAEIFHIIEHFCQGRRRLHLFGRDSTLRAGWLTVGSELSASNFDSSVYNSYFVREPSNGHLLGSSEEIERLRPKSPPPRFPGGGNQRTSSATAPPQSVAVANAMSAMLGTGTWSSATSNASFDAQKNQTGSRRLGSSSIPTTTTTHSRFRLNNNNNGTNGNNNAASDLIWRGNTSSNIFSSSSNSDNPLINMLLANQRRAQLNTNDMPVSLPSAWPLVSTSLTKNNSLLLNAMSNATTASRNSSLAALQAAAVMMSGLQQQNSQYQHNQYHLRLAQQQTQSIMNSHMFRNNPLDVFSAPSSGVLPNPFAGLVTSANDNSGFLGNNNNKTAMALQLFAAAASLRSSSAILPGSSSFTDSDSTSTSSDIGRRSGHR